MEDKDKITYWKSVCMILVLFTVGATCNFIVMTSNGGKMPVKMNWNYNDSRHFSYNDSTEFCVRNEFLADNSYFPNGTIYSFGDMLIYTSIFAFFFTLLYNFLLNLYIPLRKKWRKFKRKQRKRKAYKHQCIGKQARDSA